MWNNHLVLRHMTGSLMYVDDMFVTREDGLIAHTKRKLDAKFEMKDLGMMHYFLGMEVWTWEVCSRDPEEVQDDGLQGHVHTYGIKPETINCCFIRVI